jgi:hypothetical protein
MTSQESEVRNVGITQPLSDHTVEYLECFSPRAVDELLAAAGRTGAIEVFEIALAAGCAQTDIDRRQRACAIFGLQDDTHGTTPSPIRNDGNRARDRLYWLLDGTGRVEGGAHAHALKIVQRWAHIAVTGTPALLYALLAYAVEHRDRQLLEMTCQLGLEPQSAATGGLRSSDARAALGDETVLHYVARSGFVDGFRDLLTQLRSEPLVGWLDQHDDPGLLVRLGRSSKPLFDDILQACLEILDAEIYAKELQRLAHYLARQIAPLTLQQGLIRIVPEWLPSLLATVLARGTAMPRDDVWQSILVRALAPGASLPIAEAGASFWDSFLSVPIGGELNWLVYLARRSNGTSQAPHAAALMFSLSQANVSPDAVFGGMSLLQHAAVTLNVDCGLALLEVGATPSADIVAQLGLEAPFSQALACGASRIAPHKMFAAAIAAAVARDAMREAGQRR